MQSLNYVMKEEKRKSRNDHKYWAFRTKHRTEHYGLDLQKIYSELKLKATLCRKMAFYVIWYQFGMCWKHVCWSKHVCNAVILSLKLHRAETRDTVSSKWFWRCFFKVKDLHNVALMQIHLGIAGFKMADCKHNFDVFLAVVIWWCAWAENLPQLLWS